VKFNKLIYVGIGIRHIQDMYEFHYVYTVVLWKMQNYVYTDILIYHVDVYDIMKYCDIFDKNDYTVDNAYSIRK